MRLKRAAGTSTDEYSEDWRGRREGSSVAPPAPWAAACCAVQKQQPGDDASGPGLGWDSRVGLT